MSLSSTVVSKSLPVDQTAAVAVLTTAMVGGDESAWEEFHRAYFDRLHRYLLVLHRGDDAGAADVLQQTMLRVVRHVRRFENEDVLWSWLTCLARCAAADAGRSRSRRARVMEKFAHWQELRRAGEDTNSDGLAALERCLTALPPDERALIEGKYFERRSYAQLAEDSGTTAKAIESKLARLRTKLRGALDPPQ